ncbi:aromatic ring-hydroxylating dioxygenase subunit alpha [Sphingobium sp. CFD-2]|uniref:aromatic ring-hydroxylating oxygenase subunit alpha n=1 Tax=Sphingobium sp. CFD-2 TaxID=2878542 RepID=UPI00214C8E5F|nr:aromatic ring-hydroxylating dioxygenase subunit alpha [Sphingobium sp. CFD-2]
MGVKRLGLTPLESDMTVAEHQFTGRGTLTETFGLGTDPVPLEPYKSKDFFELEKETIFGRAWLYVCREEEIPAPGSFIVKDILPFGISALITHTKAGRIQAFYNSCPHRGSIVVKAPEGNASRFSCPYHRWTFSNEGDLLGVPDKENFFPTLQKEDCGLAKIATSTWDGFVFINFSKEPEVSLEEFLGPVKDHLAGMYYPGASNPVVYTAVLDANWKVAQDAFIESYHIPHIHKNTIGTTFASKLNPYSRLIGAKPLGAHRTISLFGNADYVVDPNNRVEALGTVGEKAGSTMTASTGEDVERYRNHAAINPDASEHWSMDIHQLFPNFHIDTGPGSFWTHQFWPLTESTCFYEVRFYVNEATTIRERLMQELFIARVGEVVLEDLENLQWTQKGVETSGKAVMHLQDSEVAIRHSMSQIVKWTKSATVKEALA